MPIIPGWAGLDRMATSHQLQRPALHRPCLLCRLDVVDASRAQQRALQLDGAEQQAEPAEALLRFNPRSAEQVTVLQTEMAASKAAAQAAAEAAARHIDALTIDLIRSDARCQELQSAHVEVLSFDTTLCLHSHWTLALPFSVWLSTRYGSLLAGINVSRLRLVTG